MIRPAARVALVTALAVTSLAACGRADDTGSGGGGTEAAELTDGPATGSLTVWAMGAEGEALPDFVADFEEANPEVDIEVVPIPWDAARDKFQTAIAAGTTPDLAMMGTTWMAEFGDAFAPVPDGIETGDFFEGPLATTELDGTSVGVPWYVDTRVLYYRTDLAEQAGWTEAPATQDDLKQMAADLQEKAGTDYGIRLQSAGNDSFQGSLWAAWSNGASLTDEDQTEWTLDTPEMVESYEYYQSFFTDGVANAQADRTPGAQEAEFVAGTTPMLIDGPFMMGQLETLGGEGFTDKYATARIPVGETSTSFAGGSNLVVFQDSANQDGAWKLIDWLSQPETQVAWYDVTGDLPSQQSAWDDATLADDAKLAVFGEQLEDTVAPPVTTTWVQVNAAADSVLERMTVSGEAPADALAELQQQASSIGMG
ncbi:extracellular solute-binding protein [Cellulomonas triticagri]|uniref:Extracellular solute-binding protein n=1 Tax=Cellulomonas triticagri TaxID=2483352 RepID=A0A3M2J3H3_9CELL|nr:extracellular solute-binding protein [Cellulomonas triticagri]RMI06606.1 extracellular solute-binding protein [Cellulomonas triticagri]